MKANTAILVTGTYRETEFLLDIFPEITENIPHDIYVVLRHTAGDVSRLGQVERDFNLSNIKADKVFFCELPSIDKAYIKEKYLVPVGPTDEDRECAILGMFQGVSTSIQMMKASLRKYDYVLKTRTDYLPPMTLPQMIENYTNTGKILVDGCASWARRYPDRYDILWQGSLNDILCFAPPDLFLKVWDFEPNLQKVWTGIPETTLFRNAMLSFLGDEIQSPRRNESFLKKYFMWDLNDTKQSFHVLRRRLELPKPDEATYFKGKEVIKYFADTKRVEHRVVRAKLLKDYVPEITRVSKHFYSYKYVEAPLLSNANTDTFKRFLEFMQANLWYPFDAVNPNWYESCMKFYREKTYQRFNQIALWDSRGTINGEEIPSANDLLEDVDWKWLSQGIPCRFHGDPQPENVLVKQDGSFCLLDWREDFAGLMYGDAYYDLAKIYHALWVSNDIIRQNKYSIREKPAEYAIEFKPNLMGFKDIMEAFILNNGYNLQKVKVLSALIYLNIAPLYQEPYSKFLYYFGRKYLYEVMR